MILSCRWLEALLDRSLDPHDLDQRLNMLGTPVEAIVPLHQDLRDVLVAQVLEVKKHPNADRLSLCTVDAGAGLVEVVCGAPNVRAQKKYPYAAVGTVLPGGLKLERKKIRGVESNGMLCSARELGLGQESDGILELETDAAPGSRFLDAVPIADYQIVLEVTANRPDLLCHRGVARELGAVYGVPVKLPAIPSGPTDGRTAAQSARPPIRQSARGVVDGVEVRLEDPEGCPRYMAAVIRGVRVGPSPAWLATRLASVGQRPINNVVDATNYVLFELNQPLHAFDLAKLRGPAVVIRRARAGERIVTLDGVERQLNPEMTAICDAERPTIVAGVMGSAESEVSEGTTDIVLECAYFQPTRIRRTRRALALSSESSYRFERGIDMLAMPDALRRAVELITATAGGEMREAPLDVWPEPAHEKTIFLRPERVGRLLGMAIEPREIEARLSSIGFFVAPKDGRLAVQVPGWRPDVTREVDLIEEVARLKGYDAFPDELRPYSPGTVPDAPLERAKTRVRQGLAAAGLYEARTFPLGPADGHHAVQVQNPMSAEEGFLRTRLLPGLVRRVERNWGARTHDVRLFEVGTVFEKGKGVEEWTSVAAVLTGSRRPPHWADGAKVPDMDLWDLKYHFELAVGLAAPSARIRVAAVGNGWEAQEPGGTVVGWAGPLEADAPVWAAPLYGLEVRLEVAELKPVAYRALPVAPPVECDLALVLPPGVTALAVADVLRRRAGPLLERLTVFDEYRGAGIPADHRSVAWHCSFRDPVRTLRENEVDKILETALQALEDELGVRRRAG
jgi:phenylalanyl-tRNA synthetase beta chain